ALTRTERKAASAPQCPSAAPWHSLPASARAIAKRRGASPRRIAVQKGLATASAPHACAAARDRLLGCLEVRDEASGGGLRSRARVDRRCELRLRWSQRYRPLLERRRRERLRRLALIERR